MKTTAVRLEDELYAQLMVVAQLEGQTVTDAIRAAVIGYIETRKTALSTQADAALAEIERDAAARRKAISDLFGDGSTSSPNGSTTTAGDDTTSPTSGRGTRTGRKDGTTSS